MHRIEHSEGLAGVDVLVLDEANLTDDRARARLYTAAQAAGTKLVEIGDPQQLRGVGCGSLFGRVHQLVDGAALTANRRQRDEDERAAIAAWREGRYGTALGSWSGRGRLVLQRQLWRGLSSAAVVGGAGLGLASSAPPRPVRGVVQVGR
jgi:hypothetical protein